MKLSFRAKGSALVPNFERMEAGVRSFVGRKFKEVEPGRYGFVPSGKAETVAFRAEYVKACQDGDLYPADLETAQACNVPFDPLFGETVKVGSEE